MSQAMDISWCLSCGRRVEDDEPYCSPECVSRDNQASSVSLWSPVESYSSDDGNDDILYHCVEPAQKSLWVGNGSAGIMAWAADIPQGAPAGAPPSAELTPTPPSRLPLALRRPKLLIPHQRPTPPTLCMTTSQPTRPLPSRSIVTPQQQIATISKSSTDIASTSRTSLQSATESSVATPASASAMSIHQKGNMIGTLASHVRSWMPSSPLPPSFQSRPCSPLPPNRLDSAGFTVLAKTHRSAALDFTPSSRSSDLNSSEGEKSAVWLVASASLTDADDRAQLPNRGKKALPEFPRGRRLGLDLPHTIRDNHFALRSRGRKVSRAIA